MALYEVIAKSFPMERTDMVTREVEFESQSTRLRGLLFEPEETLNTRAAVVMAHGFSATIDGMVADRYAERFAEAGITALLYDHPHFGRSDGEPRQRISVWRQARGYLDAITFMTSQPNVSPERIAIWGDSLSAGEAILVASIDSRVAALVAQVPSCGRTPPPIDVEADSYLQAVRACLESDFASAAFSEGTELPVVSADQLGNHSQLEQLTAFRWFIEYGGRFGTNWYNRATRSEPAQAAPFYPVICAGKLSLPVLFVVARNDEMPGSRPDVALMAFNQVQGPKQLIEIEGGHFGLLHHPGPLFEQAATGEVLFLRHHLVDVMGPVEEISP